MGEQPWSLLRKSLLKLPKRRKQPERYATYHPKIFSKKNVEKELTK
jgi:hypothetical protein